MNERHDDDTLVDEALERRLEWGIREAAGERAPDVAHAVLARLAAAAPRTAVAAAGATPSRSRGARWLAAAVVLLGVSAVVGAFVATRAPGGDAVRPALPVNPEEPDPAAPAPEPQDPQPIPVVTDAAQIALLPADLRAVELRNQDDAAVAALVARCPRLEHLRITCGTADEGDRSITDRGVESIAALAGLRRLELQDLHAVRGGTLRSLRALPLLSTLALRRTQVPGEALDVLPLLPSLTTLELTQSHAVGEVGMQHVARCVGLRQLDLSGCLLRPQDFDALSTLTALRELDVSDIGREIQCRVTGAGDVARIEQQSREAGVQAEVISRWFRLQRLDLSGSPKLEPEVGRALRVRCFALREIDVSDCTRLDDGTVAELVQLAYLRSLDLGNCPRVSRASFPRLLEARRLREIGLDGCTWLTIEDAERLFAAGKRVRCVRADDAPWNAAMEALAQRFAEPLAQPEWWQVRTQNDLDAIPDDVTHVKLCMLGDGAVHELAKRSNLLGFEFVRSEGREPLTDAGLRLLARSQTLETVNLWGADDLSAGSLALLAPLRSLRRLRVVGGAFDDSSVQAVVALPELEHLDLVGLRAIGDEAMQAVATCTRLRSLSLNHCGQLGAASLARIRTLANLESLHLRDLPALDDGVLAALQRMTRLRDLQLGEQSAFTTAGLADLPPTLQELGIDHCTGLDAGAGKLLRDRCPELRTLSATGNPWLDDTALAAILQLPRLADLTIHACANTTAASLPALRGATSLRRLAATGAPWLTAEVVAALQGERPDLRVEYKVW